MKEKKREVVSGKPRREYDNVYREEAVRYWKTTGRTAEVVAEELGVGVLALYRWNQQMKKQQGTPPPGVDARSAAEKVASLELEIKRLRKANARLEDQKDILKKAMGILKQAPRSSMPSSNP
jgi:transposase